MNSLMLKDFDLFSLALSAVITLRDRPYGHSKKVSRWAIAFPVFSTQLTGQYPEGMFRIICNEISQNISIAGGHMAPPIRFYLSALQAFVGADRCVRP